MNAAAVRWIDSTSWELPFYGLPSRIPWPESVDPAIASREPLEVEHLLQAIEQLGPEAEEPWRSFLAASDSFADLLEALEENELPKAIAALDEIDRLLPDTAFAMFHRGLIARREGADEDAIDFFRAAAEKTPNVSSIWSNIGSLHALRGQRDEAVTAFRKALEMQPRDEVALEGLVALRELVKLRTNDPRQQNAVRYVDIPTFRQIAEQQVHSMTDAEALFNYGDQLLRDGTAVEAAVLAFQRSSEIRPAQPKVMHALATALRLAGRPEEAKSTLDRYTQMYPEDAVGFLHLAQTCQQAGDEAGEKAALEKVLTVDPNNQAALAVKFEIAQGEHDPAKQDALAAYGAEHKSWMAYLLAAAVARERGDHRAVLREVEKAYELQPEQEEVLLHLASALAERKELARLTQIIRPAVESEKFSKGLDWHYAHVLRQMNLNKDAIGILERALTSGQVTDEFRQMVLHTLDAWKGLLTGCGIRLEITGGAFLQRPLVIALEDGDDGGMLIQAGAHLPQDAKFPWRAQGQQTSVGLQQGESGGSRDPQKLGQFHIRGYQENAGPLECHLVALPDGALHFRATQGGQKLEVAWGR